MKHYRCWSHASLVTVYKSYITNSWKYVLKKTDKKEKKKNGSYKAFFITRKYKKDN